MIKDLINKLDKVLKFSKQSFKISKVLNSDVEVEYAELVEGAEVLTSSSTGSAPATDGEYTLENGDSFLVKDGVIAEVISIQPEEEEVEEMDKEKEDEKIEEVIEEVVETSEDVETVEIDITSENEESESNEEVEEDEKEKHEVNEIEALKAEVQTLKEMIETLKAELPKSIEDFKNSFMKELKTTPAQSFNKVVREEENENDKWSRMAKQFS